MKLLSFLKPTYQKLKLPYQKLKLKQKPTTYLKLNTEYCSDCKSEIVDISYCKTCQYEINNIKLDDACVACSLDIERGDSELIYHPILTKLVRIHHACHLIFIGNGHALCRD